MSRARARLSLAVVLTVLIVVVLPRSARAAPSVTPAAAAHGATTTLPAAAGAGTVCQLPGLVRSDGTPCPTGAGARRQLLGLPSPAHLLPNPAHVITGIAGGVAGTLRSVALKLIVGWVASGAESALKDTAKVIGRMLG